MKKQIKPSIKAHLLPTLFILLSLLAIGVIPFAQAQRNATKQNATKQNATKQNASKASAVTATTKVFNIPATRPETTGPVYYVGRPGTPPAPKAPQVVLWDQYNSLAT